MITFKSGDLFDEDVDAIVNPVNCVSVMGKGLALQFKQRFPENFRAYDQACKDRKLMIGKVFSFEIGKQSRPGYIINFPTKNHWRDKSKLQDIESGLLSLVDEIERLQLRSLAIPALGCGLGGLNWADVKQLISGILDPLDDVQITVFEPE